MSKIVWGGVRKHLRMMSDEDHKKLREKLINSGVLKPFEMKSLIKERPFMSKEVVEGYKDRLIRYGMLKQKKRGR